MGMDLITWILGSDTFINAYETALPHLYSVTPGGGIKIFSLIHKELDHYGEGLN